jgi:hypothetical protein
MRKQLMRDADASLDARAVDGALRCRCAYSLRRLRPTCAQEGGRAEEALGRLATDGQTTPSV